MAQHWVYHPTDPAQIVESESYQSLLKKGWYDSPVDAANAAIAARKKKTKSAEVTADENGNTD